MVIWGMEVRHPDQRTFCKLGLLISAVIVIGIALNWMGALPSQLVWPVVSGTCVGAILHAFGISLEKYGTKAGIVTIVLTILLTVLNGKLLE